MGQLLVAMDIRLPGVEMVGVDGQVLCVLFFV